MASTAALELLISLDDQASKGMDDIAEKGGGIGDAVKGGAVIAGAAILGLGAVLVGATQAAADDEAETARLNNTLKNAIPNWDGNTDAIADYITKQQDMAFGDSELRDSLGFLVGQTGDLTEAQNLQATAMDLARAKGISLEQATKAVGKVDNDSIGILKKLGITVTDQMTKEEALTAIREQSAGQAETYANSAAGSMERVQNSMGEALESVGAAILPLVSGPLQALADWFSSPEVQAGITTIAQGVGEFLAGAFTVLQGVINTVLPVIQGIFQFVIDNKELVFGALATVITAFVIPAFIAWATTMLTVALPALIATMAPILAAAAPFLAIAAAIGLLWLAFENNFLGIRDLVVPVVEAIVAAVSRWWTEIQPQAIAAWEAISTTVVNAWNWLSGIVVAGVLALMDAWNTNWGGIQTIVTTAWNTISAIVTTAWTIVSGIISAGLSLLSGDWETAWTTIQTLLSDVWTLITTDLLPNALTMIWTLLTDFLPKLILLLGDWALAFFNWVMTDIVPNLPTWLANIATALWTWLSQVATDLWTKLINEWVPKLWEWITGEGGVLSSLGTKLGEIWTALTTWLGKVATDLGTTLLGWVTSFWLWITGPDGVIAGLGTKLGEIWTGITTWVDKTIKDIGAAVGGIGKGLVDGIAAGIKGAWDGMIDWLMGLIKDNIPQFIKDWLGIKSPSTVMSDIFKELPPGMTDGINRTFPAFLVDVAGKMVQVSSTITGGLHQVLTDADMTMVAIQAGLTQVGANITGAIQAGMESAYGGLMTSWMSFFDGVLGWAKDRAAEILALVNYGTAGSGTPVAGGPATGAGGGTGGGRLLGATMAGGGITPSFAGGGGGGGGGNVYITVNAGIGSDGYRIADEIIEIIEQRMGDQIAIRNGTRSRP